VSSNDKVSLMVSEQLAEMVVQFAKIRLSLPGEINHPGPRRLGRCW